MDRGSKHLLLPLKEDLWGKPTHHSAAVPPHPRLTRLTTPGIVKTADNNAYDHITCIVTD